MIPINFNSQFHNKSLNKLFFILRIITNDNNDGKNDNKLCFDFNNFFN